MNDCWSKFRPISGANKAGEPFCLERIDANGGQRATSRNARCRNAQFFREVMRDVVDDVYFGRRKRARPAPGHWLRQQLIKATRMYGSKFAASELSSTI